MTIKEDKDQPANLQAQGDWMETPHLTSGLFDGYADPDDIQAGAPLRPNHSCAKCGTGYAGPECKANSVGPTPTKFRLTQHDYGTHVVRELLASVIGENVTREGLLETPERVVKAWKAWSAGYHQDPAQILKSFSDGAQGTTGQWVIVKDIPIYSHCEHHLAPFFGTATIGYMPDGRVVGLSKLSRLADVFAKRLQVQERLTTQIADALMEHVQPLAAMVIIHCRHMCMESRGVARSGASTLTQCFRSRAIRGEAETFKQRFFDQLKAI